MMMMMTMMVTMMTMMMMIGYQTHDENIREAELEASSCARERGSPVLALQDVRVKPVRLLVFVRVCD